MPSEDEARIFRMRVAAGEKNGLETREARRQALESLGIDTSSSSDRGMDLDMAMAVAHASKLRGKAL